MWICPECRQIYDTRVERCERDGAPVAEVHAHQTKARYPLLGRVVGERYRLIGGLGQGGLGTVYLGQHLHLGQLFAVKFLDLQSIGAGAELDDTQKSGYRRDFLKEAQVASLVRHPAVVRVTDFGENEGLPFLVMEYVPGPSLLQVVGSRGRFPVNEAVAIGRRIAEALDAFHERRLVHRDLKPANVILDPRGDGRLTLVDLGLVKDLSGIGAKASTHPLALRGTPGYLAPEQVPAWVLAQQGVRATSEKRIVDARVDLYALGVIFYEMLAGVSPYPDGSNTSVIVYACTRDPIPFSTVDPPLRVPAALEALIYQTMHRDPEQRPATAAEFLERLDAVTMGQAVQGSWPAVIAPDLRRPELGPDRGRSEPLSAAPVGPEGDPLARLGRLVPDVPLDSVPDPDDDGLESTAVFTDADMAGVEPALPSPPAPVSGSPAAVPGVPLSAERRPHRAGLPELDLSLRQAAAASPDRTLEADVLDPEDMPGEADRDARWSEAGVLPAVAGLEDADFDLDMRTQVERVSPGRRGGPGPVPVPSAVAGPPGPSGPAPVASRESTRPTAEARRAKPPAKASPWRIPVALLLTGAAAATGFYFARRADNRAEAGAEGEAEVLHVGDVDAGPDERSPATAPPTTAPPTTASAPQTLAVQAPSAPSSTDPLAPATATVTASTPPSALAGAAAPESAGRRKPPTGGLDQLLAEGNIAYSAGDLPTALARFEAFLKRAGEGHPRYWEIQPRVEKLREKLSGGGR